MKKIIGITSALLFPSLALAAELVNTTNIYDTVKGLINVINLLIPFFLALAVLFFIYGLIKYVLQADAEGRKEARGYIIWGIVAIAVILSIYGLVRVLQNTFGVTDNTAIPAPKVIIPSKVN